MDPFNVSPSVLARFLQAHVDAGPAFLLACCDNNTTRGAQASENPMQDIIHEIWICVLSFTQTINRF